MGGGGGGTGAAILESASSIMEGFAGKNCRSRHDTEAAVTSGDTLEVGSSSDGQDWAGDKPCRAVHFKEYSHNTET